MAVKNIITGTLYLIHIHTRTKKSKGFRYENLFTHFHSAVTHAVIMHLTHTYKWLLMNLLSVYACMCMAVCFNGFYEKTKQACRHGGGF